MTYLGKFFYGNFHPIFHFRLRLMQLNECEVTCLNAVNFWSNKFLFEQTRWFSNLICNEIVSEWFWAFSAVNVGILIPLFPFCILKIRFSNCPILNSVLMQSALHSFIIKISDISVLSIHSIFPDKARR